ISSRRWSGIMGAAPLTVVSSSLDIQAPEARCTTKSAAMAGILANHSSHDSSGKLP
nr:hypothetical protein [Tanacetum cinerariifolium]